MTSHLSGRTVLITGGAGYVAASIVRSLRGVDCRILRLMRPGRQAMPVSGNARLQDVTGDVCERQTWDSLLPEADVVFHLAAQTSAYQANEDPSADFEANVRPMLHLLGACRRLRRRPVVVFAGTVTEAGLPDRLPVNESHPDRPITIYDLHKLMAESYLRHYTGEGIVCGVILRLANVYGPGPASSRADRGVLNGMIRRALRGEPLTIYGAGNHLRDYVFIEDVAQAFLRAACANETVNGRYFVIGTGEGHTVSEAIRLVADRVAARTGRQVPVTHVEPPTRLSPIEARNFVADPSRFRDATGWHPGHSLRDGIDRTIEAFLCGS
jgi:nucleoside-diphosphate-sugar epimerase